MKPTENPELRDAMRSCLLNAVAYRLSDWTCTRLREGKTIEALALAAQIPANRWWDVIERKTTPELHEVASMAFALGAHRAHRAG